MARLVLSLLGPPIIECDDKPIQVNTRKAAALLVYLAVTGASQTRDALATLFWPESDQAHARGALRVALSTLKKALGDRWLDIERENIALEQTDDLWLDVDHFGMRLVGCHSHGHLPDQVCQACLAPLSEAVGLYRGDFLAGFSLRDSPGFEDWQRFHAENLRSKLVSALERLVRYHSALAAFELAITYAQRWLALDPLHEPAHRRLMQLYAWAGRRAAALRQYGECVQILGQELSVPPQEETVQLCQAIREDYVSSPLTRVLPTRPSAWWRTRHLPPFPGTQLFGVEETLAQLSKWLQVPHDHWLISIEGMGGLGKTSLVREAAVRVAETDHFVDIAWLTAKRERYTWRGLELLARSALTYEGLLDAINEQLGDGDLGHLPLSDKQERIRALLKARLYLIVVDSLETAVDYDVLLDRLWEMAGPTKFLFTSRHKIGARRGLSVLSLNEPSEPDALAFLRYEGHRCNLREIEQATDGDLHSILAATGANPHAIKFAVSQLAHLPLAQLLASLQSVDPLVAPFYQHLFRASWALLSPAAKRLLFYIALLPASGGDWQDLQAISDLDKMSLVSAIEELSTHSLLRVRGLVDKNYAICRLSRHFVLNHAPEALGPFNGIPTTSRQRTEKRP